jgi:cytochrome P450
MAVQAPTAERPPGVGRVIADTREELRRRPQLPPGPTSFSLRRTHRFQRDTLATTLHYRELYGDVYTARMFHRLTVVMLGPEANHFVTVTGADNFSWRQGMFGEHLIPLIGDGLITTDGEYHDRARKIMMPAFHRERMDASLAVMQEEAVRALDALPPGETVDVYHWMRDLSMSIAMRALVGLEGSRGHEAAEAFERALSFYDTETFLMLLRGPGSPWWRLQRARRELDRIVYDEIARRRARGTGDGSDALSMLLDARDEEGEGFTDRELRDQTMHLLFGGHDTASSTLSFLVYELARNPEVTARLRAEQERVLGGRPPTVDELLGELPELTMAMDETLRLYPPVWFGPRMTVRDFEFRGHAIPAGVHIHHSSWASHRLPDVFPEPDEFRPERFTPEARAALPKGAYIPFGGGRRICIGKRFGQLVVRAVAASLLQRYDFELEPGYELTVDKLPTLSPRGGLPVRLRSL